MFLRCHTRKKNGKLHRYWSVVESRRVAGGEPVQRHLLHPGEINDSQEAAWRKTLTVFDEQRQRDEQLALFPADRPLPAGRLRFYRQDDDGRLEFIGENEIGHTPRNETLRVYTGNAFDIVGERWRMNYQVNEKNNQVDESFEIKLRNHKDEPVTVRVVERLYRWHNWEIRERSQDFVKKDAQTIEFSVAVPPGGEQTVTYLVHYWW